MKCFRRQGLAGQVLRALALSTLATTLEFLPLRPNYLFPSTTALAQDGSAERHLPKDDSPADAETIQRLTSSESGRITAMAFSPDGRWLAAGLQNSFVVLWDSRTGKEARVFDQFAGAGAGAIKCLAFSADGRHLLMSTELSQSVFVVAVGDGSTKHEVKCRSFIFAAQFAPNGKLAAVSDGTRTITLIPIGTSQPESRIGPFARDVNVMAFAPDSSVLAVCFGRDIPDGVQAFDCKSGKSVWESRKTDASPFLAIEFILGGKAVAAVDRQGMVRCLDSGSGKPFTAGKNGASTIESGQRDADRIISFNNGTRAAVCGSQQFALLDFSEMTALPVTTRTSDKQPSSGYGKFSAGSQSGPVLTMSEQVIRVYSAKSGMVLRMPCGDRQPDLLTMTPDGAKAAVCWQDKAALIRLSLEEQRQAEQSIALAKMELEAQKEAEKRAAERAQRAAEEAEKARRLAKQKAAEEEKKAAILAKQAAEEAARQKLFAKQAAEESARQKLLAEKQAEEREKRRRNSAPQWRDYEDLNEILSRFCQDGDEPHDDDFDPPDEDTANFGVPQKGYAKLRLFILYGTIENAKKAVAGDRFDREDVAAAASKHRERVSKTKFFMPCKYFWHEGAETRPDAIKLHVLMPCRCIVRRPSSTLSACDVFTGWWWSLDETTGSLKKCFNRGDAVERRERGLELYVPEDVYQTHLMVTVEAPREVLKLIARNPEACTINVGVSGFRLERPRQAGFFRTSVLEKCGDSTDFVLRSFASGLNGPKGTPNYFVTQVAGKGAERSPPEVIMCDFERLEVVQATPDERNVLFEVERMAER